MSGRDEPDFSCGSELEFLASLGEPGRSYEK